MGQLNLPDSSLIYLDTVTIIYSVERFPSYITLLDPMWQQLQSSRFQVITSELALLETLVLPIRQNNRVLLSRYETLLTLSEVNLIPISQSILRSAANIRAEANLRTPDAIHAATAIESGCTMFLTNDLGFRRIANFPVVILQDILDS
ncbi:PilT protein-like protein [Leptolyngbya sp. NIES-3755]|nr:PilT protein-like protein [Leptolyngbya sp. NIES-3755]